jgi:uncharacterized RDD family membrane protein YckC
MSAAAYAERSGRRKRERTMVTPEGIALPATVATRSARFAALTLDLIFVFGIMLAVSVALVYIAQGTVGLGRAEEKTSGAYAAEFLFVIWIIAMFLFRYGWFLWFELGARGATPGKRICGIRVASRDGGRLTAEMVIARNLLRDIEIFMPVLLIIGAGVDSGPVYLAATAWFALFMLFPFFNRDAMRAGDLIAGTWVVEAPKVKLAPTMTGSDARRAELRGEARYRFSDAELAVYGEFELQTLERVLRDGRASAIEPVYQTIASKIDRNDGWGDERAFLEAYYLQLRARLEAGMRMGRRKADKHGGVR